MTRRCRTCHFRPCRCEDLASGCPPMGYSGGTWPMKSEGMAVHPEQIQEALDRNKKHGITGVTYDRNGTAIIGSPREKAKLMKLEGVVDKNGGYGDTYSGTSALPTFHEEGADEFTDAGPQKSVQERNSGYQGD